MDLVQLLKLAGPAGHNLPMIDATQKGFGTLRRRITEVAPPCFFADLAKSNKVKTLFTPRVRC